MDEAQLLRVFERFYQADSKKEGVGIGLALVKAFCDSAGIDIAITSQRGTGTQVVLKLNKLVHTAFTP